MRHASSAATAMGMPRAIGSIRADSTIGLSRTDSGTGELDTTVDPSLMALTITR